MARALGNARWGSSARRVLVAAVFVQATIAMAESRVARAECLILEAHVGERPADADEILEPFKEPLKAKGCRDARDVVHDREDISRPAIRVSPATLKTYEHDAREGFQKYSDGDYDAAIEVLGRLVAIAEDSPGALVGKPSLRTAHRLALIGMAMAYRKLALKAASEADAAESVVRSKRAQREAAELVARAGEARGRAEELMKRAKDRMESVVRIFGAREVQRSEFGGETFDFYELVKKELHARRKTVLEFHLNDDPSGVLYVNGEYADLGTINMEVLSGPTTILIRWGTGANAILRFYRRVLSPGGLYVLRTTRRFEEALHTGTDWCCMLYPSTASRDEHLETDLVRILKTSDDTAVVMSIQPRSKGSPRSVIGQVHNGRDFVGARRVRVSLEPGLGLPSRQERIEIGRYWAGQRYGYLGPNVEVDVGAEARARAGSPSWTRGLALAGAGIAAGTAGGYLLHGQSTCAREDGCRDIIKLGGSAVLLCVGAFALGAASFELIDAWRSSRGNAGLSFTLRPDTATIGWAWSLPP
jgi:hypothetical protein